MKYAIQVDYYMHDGATWLYLALQGEHKIFIFEDNVNEKTKLFDTAKEAGEYVDKHFGADRLRCSFSTVRIVEV